ncbi:protein FAR-RED IMPAIRED RESPONSE 1 isoform X1 [Hevea brasiliensis]|uniref:protein FAR-RED IMPAIRED RESPONSE 1 isoform X1 n=1 Tax=Hevea brasiliensis TaxID=3981 RepID=UPI0025F278FC|nr:protein FAR-RED IMPAIRED RESPONSE 1 isoform X1 [Hevea brasiliensis]
MFSMGIDLEQPSGECHKEDSRPNVNADMVDSGLHDRNRVAVDCCNVAGTDKDRPTVSGRVFDGTHKVYVGDGINLNAAKDLEPHDGMEFESKEEAFSFYKEYAKSVGFATIIKASRRSRISGKFIDAKFVCTRYGTKREPSMTEMAHPVMDTDVATSIPVKRKRGRINRSWSKTDCKACMHVKRRQHDGKWVVRSFIKEHNHAIYPDQAYFFRGHRNIGLGSNNVDALHAIRARTKKVYVSMSRQSGGYKKQENQKRSLTNISGSTQHLALDEGDAQVMLEHFRYMQDENPNFFYAIDLNEEQCLRNVFWVDAKARLDYGYFDDVIIFDTTYIKSEYKLPFAPFIGVNHHFQCLLLGCALVADETKSTYVWLMRAWLRAMGGLAPRVILTDQDKSLEQAIAEVFPNSHHCFCLWHLLSKIPEKLGNVIRQHENFMTKFNKCIFKSWTNEQFEKRWWKMAERFNLRNDLWFQSLYEDRQKWMPMYMRDKFLAGMSTTQRSDSISSFFDKHMQRKTTLKEFLEQYKAILQGKFEEEAKADFESWHKQPGLKSPSPFGKQMATLYTHAIFKKFQVEVLGVVACHPRKDNEDGETKTFKVQDFEENEDFIVVWKGTSSYFSCSCRSFEFNGFLCRHVLIVMQMSGVHSIPSQYILKRWTKDAKSRETSREQSGKVESRVQRYNDLCRRAFKLGDEGSLSLESYNIAFSALEDALRNCENVNNSIHCVIEPNSPSPGRPHDYEEANHATGVSKTNKKDSISRKKQVHSEPDVMSVGMHESWQQLLNSRAPNLDGYFGPQQIVQGMGQLNSLASSCDDYYSNEHSMQRLGQLNAIASIHEAHFITQQRIQGMGQLHCRSETIPSCFDTHDGLQEMDQSNVGPSQLHSMVTKNLHPKRLSH